MTGHEFLSQLESRLSDLPKAQTESFLAFYRESIADRVEEGLTEEDAVAQLGDLDTIEREIRLEMPLGTLVKSKVQAESVKVKESPVWIILAILGAPIWLALGAGVLAAAVCVYAAIWAFAVSIVLTVAALVLAVLGLLVGGVFLLFSPVPAAGLLILGAALICAGIAFLVTPGVSWLVKKLAQLSVRFVKWLKGRFVSKKEAA